MLYDPAMTIDEIIDAIGNDKNPPTLTGLKKYMKKRP